MFVYLGGERSVEGLLNGLTLVTIVDGTWSANHFRGEDGGWLVVDEGLVWDDTEELLVSELFNVSACLFLLDVGQLTGSP